MQDSNKKSSVKSSAAFRRNFVTGLLILAPLWITGYIILTVVRLLGGFLSPYFRHALEAAVSNSENWTGTLRAAADISAFLVTIAFITIIGFIVRFVVGKNLIEIINRIVGQIPVIREIYESLRKFIDVFFGDRSKFKRVVAVRFPTERCWSLAFVTGEVRLGSTEDPDAAHLTVYIPTAPIPTSGFLVMAREADVIPLAISVDEALKILISGGTLTPDRIMPAS